MPIFAESLGSGVKLAFDGDNFPGVTFSKTVLVKFTGDPLESVKPTCLRSTGVMLSLAHFSSRCRFKSYLGTILLQMGQASLAGGTLLKNEIIELHSFFLVLLIDKLLRALFFAGDFPSDIMSIRKTGCF